MYDMHLQIVCHVGQMLSQTLRVSNKASQAQQKLRRLAKKHNPSTTIAAQMPVYLGCIHPSPVCRVLTSATADQVLRLVQRTDITKLLRIES